MLFLVVDDEADIRSFLARLLASRGYQVVTASGPADAKRLAESQTVDVLITDIDMEGVRPVSRLRMIYWSGIQRRE